MIPYADSLYFSALACLAAAAIVLGLTGRLTWRWVVAMNATMLAFQYGAYPTAESVREVWVVLAHAACEWGVTVLFLRARRRGKSVFAFRAALGAALLPLVIVKVAPLGLAASYLGFLGISYVTFRSVDVVICIQDGLITTLPAGRYFTFLLFFPTISAGPIDRFNRFRADTERHRTRAEFVADLDQAVQHLFRGLLYKFVLAAVIKQYWLDPVAPGPGAASVLSYMYAYTFYLFFDFAGYSAFAIGTGFVFGIRTPENFNRPFLAGNIVEFWNRWHITLSFWFRDHVYMRFVMAALRGRWFKSRLVMSCAAFYVSFGLMGVWHGLEPRYLVYGLYHATMLSAYTVLVERRRRLGPRPRHAVHAVGAKLQTFHMVAFGLLIFSGRLG
jgi:membrane protein involved in D-alanine export